MGIVFKPILTLEIWHDYFLGPLDGSGDRARQQLPAQYDISRAIALVPTAACQKALRQLRWLFRPQPYGGVVLAQVEESESGKERFIPFVAVDPYTRLTFWLKVRDRNFANYTHLSLKPGRDLLYYFSNQSNNQTDNALYLTRPLQPYQAGATYAIGDLVTYQPAASEPPLTLEAGTWIDNPRDPPTRGSANPADFETSPTTTVEWIAAPASQYVSPQDLHLIQSPSCTESLAQASPGATLTLVDINQQASVVYQVPEQHPPNTDLKVSFLLDQSSGRYQLFYQSAQATENKTLNKALLGDFVLFDPAVVRQAIALIELSLNPSSLSPPFQLLSQRQNQTQQLHSKTYQIRFKNRSTRWRYHANPPPEVPFPQPFEAVDTKTFVTPNPVGHYFRPPKPLRDGKDRPLPVPSPTSPLAVEFADNGNRDMTAIFSDLYL